MQFSRFTILANVLLLCSLKFVSTLHSQTFSVIHSFNGRDGNYPIADLVMDRGGRLYGTTPGNSQRDGSVFRLSPSGGVWVLNTLHSFTNGLDGGNPLAGVVIDTHGSLYGTTQYFGQNAVGVAFKLSPPATISSAVSGGWIDTTLYSFGSGLFDGFTPGYGDLVFDRAGNLYGTTQTGGSRGVGVVYELSPLGSGWTENVIYSFHGGGGDPDGSTPLGGLIVDGAGNLYGTTYYGGTFGIGTVFELSPSGSGWTEQVLYSFAGIEGYAPVGRLLQDDAGNLFATASKGGPNNGGTVFELVKSTGWAFNLVYPLTGPVQGTGPWGGLVRDASGNLYGTTVTDGLNNAGTVFKLTPASNGWTYTSLHDFTNGSDGGQPWDSLLLDAQGNLFGTAQAGGANGFGDVFEISQ